MELVNFVGCVITWVNRKSEHNDKKTGRFCCPVIWNSSSASAIMSRKLKSPSEKFGGLGSLAVTVFKASWGLWQKPGRRRWRKIAGLQYQFLVADGYLSPQNSKLVVISIRSRTKSSDIANKTPPQWFSGQSWWNWVGFLGTEKFTIAYRVSRFS